MAVITFDGHSFSADGRRLWLVSGTIHFTRTPRELWRDRIRAAHQAGLNTIEVPVCWSAHETKPGAFRFDGGADLRHFIQLIAEQGMYAILRPGPFIGDGYDMGGLPPWLLVASTKRGATPAPTSIADKAAAQPLRLRESSPAFLQAVARYLDAVLEQVRDLQATANGPIVAVQNEHQWFCNNDEQGDNYLQQISRYLRESGCTVPLLSRNNLWQPVPGAVETWHGDHNAFAAVRQLDSLQPDSPCLMHISPVEEHNTWGRGAEPGKDPQLLLRRLAEVSAAGAMFNISPFAASMALDTCSGRLTGAEDRFLTSDLDAQSPLSITGQRTESYTLIKRLAMFLSQFGSHMAGLRGGEHHTVAAGPLSVVQQSAAQGHIVFVFRDPLLEGDSVELITPDGQTLLVPMGEESVAWLMLGANLEGVATLDLTNLRPWAMLDKRLLVLFGPAGSQGIFSLDGKVYDVSVPAASQPLIVTHDDMRIAVLSTEQIDAAYLHAGNLYIGVGGIDESGEPLPHPDHAAYSIVTPDGQIQKRKHATPPRSRPPQLGPWTSAPQSDYATGAAPRFATLPGPASLEACGADRGYGWYRLRLTRNRPTKIHLLIPQAADRIHLYQNGKLRSVLGVGPGASGKPLPLNLPKGDSDLVFLADNLGRFSDDILLAQPKGIFGHLLDVKPLPLPRFTATAEPRIDPFTLAGYVPGCSREEHGPFPRFTFAINLAAKSNLVLQLRGDRPRSVLLVNNQPIVIDAGRGVTASFVLDMLRKGPNKITLALIDPADDFDPRRTTQFFKVLENLTEDAAWWFARWQAPDAKQFAKPTSKSSAPAFFRSTFTVSSTAAPLALEIAGATKGQFYLNGRNLGRYFIATANGSKVPPQSRYYLPSPWLKPNAENEIILFDEHGKSPRASRIVPAS